MSFRQQYKLRKMHLVWAIIFCVYSIVIHFKLSFSLCFFFLFIQEVEYLFGAIILLSPLMVELRRSLCVDYLFTGNLNRLLIIGFNALPSSESIWI